MTRDGQAGMTAIFKAISGSVSAPGITFNSDATAGLFLQNTGIVGLVAKSLGLLVNSSIYQATSATVQSGGSGYAVGDVIQAAGGTSIWKCHLTVATLSGSAVSTVTVSHPGNYTVTPSNPVSQFATDGSGSGATFNLTFAAQFASSVVTDESGALPWQRLGSSSFVSGLMGKVNAYDFLSSLVTAGSGIVISHATNPVISATLNPSLVPNYLSGLTLSTIGASQDTVTIAAGVANDTTNTVLMNLASAISKKTGSWAVGTGNGGLDTGAIAINTWYHFYLIERTDTGVVDVIFSLSASAPALPTNYTLYRRIGSLKTNGSSLWNLYTQSGDQFIWAISVNDNNSVTASRASITLTVPTGIIVTALFRANLANGSSNAVIYTSLFETDQAPNATGLADLSNANGGTCAGDFARLTNTSAQIGGRGTGSLTPTLNTYGWIDTRGK